MPETLEGMSDRLDLTRAQRSDWTKHHKRDKLRGTMTTATTTTTSKLRFLRHQAANDSAPADLRRADPYVEKAIAAMKAEPSRRWTVAKLARVGGLSRAAFARRFKEALKVSPLRWLTEHRLRIAETRLVETDLGLAGIAIEVGYQSEFAFAKAFKRLFGTPPGLYRRRIASRFATTPVRAAA